MEQPVDILIKKLTKLSIIDININSWSKYQIWPKFQKLTKMSTVDKNVKFDKNIKFDQNINLTKMSNLRCTFSKMYLPLPHLLPFDYLGDSSVLDQKEIFPSLILFCVSWNLVIGHQGQGGTDETNVFTVLVLQRIVCVCVCECVCVCSRRHVSCLVEKLKRGEYEMLEIFFTNCDLKI